MIAVELISGLIVACGAIITGIIAAARWFYRRGQQAQQTSEDMARIASDIAKLKSRDAGHGDGETAVGRRESIMALVILAAAAAGWLIRLRWWNPSA
jgi:hypothetical protein